jgi:hypothetical protein
VVGPLPVKNIQDVVEVILLFDNGKYSYILSLFSVIYTGSVLKINIKNNKKLKFLSDLSDKFYGQKNTYLI